jgi:hypothetical protein
LFFHGESLRQLSQIKKLGTGWSAWIVTEPEALFYSGLVMRPQAMRAGAPLPVPPATA